jgi:hypothetical protein
MVVRSGTVAVAMYCGRLPMVVVMPDMVFFTRDRLGNAGYERKCA